MRGSLRSVAVVRRSRERARESEKHSLPGPHVQTGIRASKCGAHARLATVNSRSPRRARAPSATARLLAAGIALALAPCAHAAWTTYGGNAQHTALSTVATQPLQRIHWQAAVDLKPQYVSNDLFIHYGSPLVTAGNTVLF